MFQELNDTISDLERVQFYIFHELHSIHLPTCKSDRLQGKKLTLKEILARIPDLASLYQQTFNESPQTIACHPVYWINYPKYGELEVSIPEIFDSLDSALANQAANGKPVSKRSKTSLGN